jgi:hypothetical protein
MPPSGLFAVPGAMPGMVPPRRLCYASRSSDTPASGGHALRASPDRTADGGTSVRRRHTSHRTSLPPGAHTGTVRHLVCPQELAAQQACASDKTKEHTVKNGLLVHAPRTLLLLRATHGGGVHEKRRAVPTPGLLGADCDRLSAATPSRAQYAAHSQSQRPEPPLEVGYPRSGAGHRCAPSRDRLSRMNEWIVSYSD